MTSTGGGALSARSLTPWAPLWVALVVLALLAPHRPGAERLWGDEGTFLAMTASLARDGDLIFDEGDREWAERRLPGEGATVILQRTGEGLAYSKPVLYPLLAAPLYLAAGEWGLQLLNLLALAAAGLLAWRALRYLGSSQRASLTLSTFVAAGVLLPYVGWRMSDVLQAALALAGLALACGPLRRRDAPRLLPEGPAAAAAAGFLLGLAAAMRLPNAALAAGAVAANLLAGRRRRAGVLLLSALLAVGFGGGLGWVLTGSFNPYKTLRTSFNAATGYPVGTDGETAAERFLTQTNTSRIGFAPSAEPARVAYAGLYFLIGRHSGLLLYFPAALLLAAIALRRPDEAAVALLAAASAMAVFYLVWIPWNYFGGSTFLGNRYFLTAYPALLIALPRLPRRRHLAWVWAIAALAAVSALVSVRRAEGRDEMSQSHAGAGLHRVLPYESTARRIDGGRDRYWADDFVRFVDPWAEVEEFGFRLESGRPPAELLIATARPGGRIEMLVSSRHPQAEIAFSDWGRDATYRLRAVEGGSRSRITLVPSPAWRRHRFWWSDEAFYRVRTMRLAVRAPRGQTASAELRYLGDGRLLRLRPAAELLSGEVPAAAEAAGSTVVELRIRNRGDWRWEPRGIVPVRLGYRVYRGVGRRPVGEGRQELPGDVAPGETLAARLEIDWPAEPGAHRLVIDLVRPGVGWFAETRGAPLAEARVRLRAARPGAVD